MKQDLIALLAGAVFGLGLAISQMLNPAKVLAFLDVAGNWDPTLAFVMAAALAVMALAWRWHARTGVTPPVKLKSGLADVDAPLVGGAAIFGIGWGLVGLCPGPALAGLALWRWEPVVFVAAMLAGMFLQEWLRNRAGQRSH
jgi:uncharacterized membrane protein YedE/YeeE